MDDRFVTQTLSQHKIIYLTLGADDGIKAGMIFRTYHYKDPPTVINRSVRSLFARMTIKVIATSPGMCLGLVISGTPRSQLTIALIFSPMCRSIRELNTARMSSITSKTKTALEISQRTQATGKSGEKNRSQSLDSHERPGYWLQQLEQWRHPSSNAGRGGS